MSVSTFQAGISLSGRQLGRYRLLELLGSGGMSVVYRGFDTALQREVAVKVLHPHLLLQTGDARRRLEREARAVARLHHPNIVEVFDVADSGTAEAFLVTELVRGETLRAFVEKQRCWPPELAATIVHQVASALAHAHQAGVVHRDLKPENVMLREDGVLKLMDFGIARVLDPAERMTQTGALVGSPAYMAPEVIDGQTAGPEADVFALGTLLYWLWTAELPFRAETTAGVLKRILDGVYEDPRSRTAGLSDELLAILGRCLESNPVERYPSAAELEAALGSALAGVGINDSAAQLAAFHLQPALERTRLVERLAAHCRAQAEAALAAGRTALALRQVDQLLGLQPEDAVGRSVLKRAQRRERLHRRLGRLGALAAAVVAAVALAVWLDVRRPWHRAPTGTTVAPLAASPPLDAAPPPAGTSSLPPALPVPPAVESPARSEPSTPARLAKAEPVAVELLVRPYGAVAVDGGPKSRDPLAAHALLLVPGRHTIRVSCEWCEESDHTIDVQPGGPQTFALPARLKTAYVRFEFEPKDAMVSVAGEQRTSEQTLSRPFALLSPRAATRFIYEVAYVISHPGYRDTQGRLEVLPGKSETVSGKLEPK
jgi:hypothetical protein